MTADPPRGTPPATPAEHWRTNEPGCSGPYTDAWDCPIHNPARQRELDNRGLITPTRDMLAVGNSIEPDYAELKRQFTVLHADLEQARADRDALRAFAQHVLSNTASVSVDVAVTLGLLDADYHFTPRLTGATQP